MKKKKFSVKNIERMLKHHANLCKMHTWSLGKDMYCSCGREKALEELSLLEKRIEELEERFEQSYTV